VGRELKVDEMITTMHASFRRLPTYCNAAAEAAIILHDVMRRLDNTSISTVKRAEEPSTHLIRKSPV
jgi:hypothetical protein